jgi:hypothetical protein
MSSQYCSILSCGNTLGVPRSERRNALGRALCANARIETLFGYTVQIGGLLHDHATLMAAGGQRIQTAMQIDQRLRNELLFRHVHSKASSPLLSAIFGLLDFARLRSLYRVGRERLSQLWPRCISIKR